MRDAIDLKRIMSLVVVALLPCVFMAFYNTGLQANRAIEAMGVTEVEGWRAAVFTGNPDLGKRMGLKASRRNAFYNGAIPCVLLQIEVVEGQFVDREALDRRAAEQQLERALAGGGEAFLTSDRRQIMTQLMVLVFGSKYRSKVIEAFRLLGE